MFNFIETARPIKTARPIETANAVVSVRWLTLLTLVSILGLHLPLLVGSGAQAGVYLDPIRIFMGPRDRTATVTMVNQNTDSTVYRIYWQDYVMTPEGQYTALAKEERGEWSVSNMIRYSPRQVRLSPGESQAVRFSLRRPAGMADGEYRSHLVVEEQPRTRERVVENPGGMVLDLQFVMAVSIPVIVYQGNLTAAAKITQLLIGPGDGSDWNITAALTSSGNKSPVGAMRIFWRTPDGRETLVKEQNNVAVWLPTRERFVTIPVKRPTGPGQFRVVFIEAKPIGPGGKRKESDFGPIFDEAVIQ